MDPKMRGKTNGQKKRLIIGSSLLSVGVKPYLISRMASKAASHSVLPCLCLSPDSSRLPF